MLCALAATAQDFHIVNNEIPALGRALEEGSI
jgi:hypothetical protein